MSTPAPKISSPADFAAQKPKPFTLPAEQNGKRLMVLLGPLSIAEMMLVEGGARAMGGDASQADPEEAVRLFTAVAQKAIIEPAFSFGAEREPGKAWWFDLLPANQYAIVMESYRLSGSGISKNGEAAKSTATFPEKRGGEKDGAAVSAPVRARAKAAP